MIPRVKAAYGPREVWRALVTSERSHQQREALTALLAARFDTGNILLTSSGRGALFLLLSVLPQRKLFVPAYTCKAVIEAGRLASKDILFGESEADGINMDPESLVDRLDSDTVLLATHQFGIPCAIGRMMEIARAAGAYVIEDAAASFGTRIGGRLAGTFGDAAIFSFDSTKLLNVPLKAGFALVRDTAVYQSCLDFAATATQPMPASRKLRYLALGAALLIIENPTVYRMFHNLKFRWRARFTDDETETRDELGPFYGDRFAEWQASVVLPQLLRVEEAISKRRRMYATYRRRLNGAVSFSMPPEDVDGEWAPIRFPIRARTDKLELYRRAVERGVDFAFSFTFIASPASFERAHSLAASILDLPFYEKLTEAELEQVASVLCQIDQDLLGRAAPC